MSRQKTPRLKDLFVEQMQEKILSGQLEIGQKLPTEREISKEMGVSRQVVNSGMAELVRQGFLKVVPRHGSYVADYRTEGNMNTLNAIMEYEGDSIREEEIRSILEIRWAIDSLILKTVIKKAGRSDLDRLEEMVEKISESETSRQAAEAMFDFEYEMALLSRNTVLSLICVSFKPIVTMLWTRFTAMYGSELLYNNAKTTLSYIKSRDEEGAKKWLDRFMGEVTYGKHQIYNRKTA